MALPAQTDCPELLQLPDVHRLERMPSWPAWVGLRIASLTTETQPDAMGRWRPTKTLPKSLMLTAGQREELEHHVHDLEALCGRTPMKDSAAERETFGAIMKLMWVTSNAAQNELSAEARGEAYMEAVDDVPVWAVQNAIRRWRRGDWGVDPKSRPYDYNWPPASADLRRFALAELHRVRDRTRVLGDLLRAEPRVNFDEDHYEKMKALFARLLRDLKSPPVGKDGSGGATGIMPAGGAYCGTRPRHSPA